MFVRASAISFIKGYNTVFSISGNDTEDREMLNLCFGKIIGNDSKSLLEKYLKLLIDYNLGAWIGSFIEELQDAKLQDAEEEINPDITQLLEDFNKVYLEKQDSVGEIMSEFDIAIQSNETEKCMELLNRLWSEIAKETWEDEIKNKLYFIGIAQCNLKMESVLIGQNSKIWFYFSDNVEKFVKLEEDSFKGGQGESGYYEFLTDKSYMDGKTYCSYNEPIFKDFEALLSKYKEIGKNMHQVMRYNFDEIRDALSSREFARFVFLTGLMFYNAADSDEFGDFILNYFPYLDTDYKTKLYIERMIVQTALNAKNLQLSAAVLNCMTMGYYGLTEKELRKNNDKEREKAIETIQESIELIGEVSVVVAKKIGLEPDMVESYIKDSLIKCGFLNKCCDFNDFDNKMLIVILKQNLLYFIETFLLKKDYDYNSCKTKYGERYIYSCFRRICRMDDSKYQLSNKIIEKAKKLQRNIKICVKNLNNKNMRYEQVKGVWDKINQDIVRRTEEGIVEKINSTSVEIKSLTEQADGEKNEEEKIKKYEELSKKITYDLSSAAFVNYRLESELACAGYEKTILKELGENTNDSLFNRVPNRRDEIKNELFQFEFLYRIYDRAPKINYANVIMPLTRSIEIVLNELFGKIKKDELFYYIDNQGKKCLTINKHFGDCNNKKTAVELGTAAHLFDDNKGKIKIWKNWWNRGGYVDLSELTKFAKIEYTLPTLQQAKDANGNTLYRTFEPYSKSISKDDTDDTNRKILFGALLYVSKEYRNKAAHIETLSSKDCEKCKKLLISEKKLFWILLATFKR